MDVISGALAGLIVSAEAPGVAFACVGDGEAVIGARGDHGAGSNDAGDLGGFEEDAGFALGVAGDVVVGESVGVHAGLAAVAAAPDEALAVLGGGEGVVGASREVDDGVVGEFEGADDGRRVDDCVVLASVVVNAGGAERIGAPGPDLLFPVDGEGMVGTACDQANVLAFETKEAGGEGFVALTLHLAEAKLILLARAPGVDDAFVVASKSVIGARGNVDDFLEVGKKDRSVLDESILVEAKDPFVALDELLASYSDRLGKWR